MAQAKARVGLTFSFPTLADDATLRAMRSSIRSVSLLSFVLSLAGASCSSPRTLSESHTASAMAPARASSMTPEQAQKVLDDESAKLFAANAQNPLRQPKSLDDVLAILQSDQIDLFAGGVKFAQNDPSLKAKVLTAQIELAWGEDLRIIAQTVDLLSADLRQEKRELTELDAVGKLSADDRRRLEALGTLLDHQDSLLAAASALAPVHLAAGAKLAESLVSTTPADYEGYRVLADYYRIRGEWPRYDAMVAEVQQRQPQSVGLLFLKGIALAERQGDYDGASKLLAEAVAKDPKFCRAQAQLFFLARGLTKKREEAAKLKAMNPQHQVVVLTGPVIETVYEAREKRRQRMPGLEMRTVPL